MGMIGTFDGFTTARLGIYAAQHGLNVTGNNISNINTVGYTRQRLDQVSLKVGNNDMYRSHYDNHIGSGALVTNINQVRDRGLDLQYRNINAKVGQTDAWLTGLERIAQTLDEVGKGKETNSNDEGDGILYAQLLDMRDMLMKLQLNPDSANDTLVRNSAATVCQLFNTYAKNLEELRKETEENFKDDLTTVNGLLSSIRDLNETIRKADIAGDNALELRDERNRKLDELSEYIHIRVDYSMEDVGAGKQVEKLTLSLGDDNPESTVHTDETILIDGIYGSQLSLQQVEIEDEKGNKVMVDDPNYLLEVGLLADGKGRPPRYNKQLNDGRPIKLADNDLYGSLQARRELLTEKGEFATQDDIDMDRNAASKRGIPYYQKSFDLLARKFAEVYNALNRGALTDKDGNVLIDEKTGTPNDLGLTKVTEGIGEGYYVDQMGFFVGTNKHQPCYLTQAQVHVDDSLKTALGKISGAADDATKKKIAGVLDANGEILAGKEDEAKKIYQDFLGEHGVNTEASVTINQPRYPEGTGPLFSNRNDRDDTDGITASNISVSLSWSTNAVKIVPTFTELFGGDITDSTQVVNINHMISKIEEALVYNPKDLDPAAASSKLFTGSFNDMYNSMNTSLGNDQKIIDTQLNTHYTQLVDTDTRRDGISGVDLNDEAMNIMQYQKAYSAACRMMTAIDEAIDRLINNTGIAGR